MKKIKNFWEIIGKISLLTGLMVSLILIFQWLFPHSEGLKATVTEKEIRFPVVVNQLMEMSLDAFKENPIYRLQQKGDEEKIPDYYYTNFISHYERFSNRVETEFEIQLTNTKKKSLENIKVTVPGNTFYQIDREGSISLYMATNDVISIDQISAKESISLYVWASSFSSSDSVHIVHQNGVAKIRQKKLVSNKSIFYIFHEVWRGYWPPIVTFAISVLIIIFFHIFFSRSTESSVSNSSSDKDKNN